MKKREVFVTWLFHPLSIFRPLYLLFQDREEAIRRYHDLERERGIGDEEFRSNELRTFTLHKN